MKDILKPHSLHEEVNGLLPWLVNDSLEGKERLKVLNHLSECALCQSERDKLQMLASSVQLDGQKESHYKPAFGRLMSQINSGNVAEQLESNSPEMASNTLLRNRRFAIALSACFVVVLGGFLQLNITPQVAPEAGKISIDNGTKSSITHTLNVSSPNLVSAPRSTSVSTSIVNNQNSVTRQLAIRFDEGIGTATLRRALISTEAYIVDGPDGQGLYIVEVLTKSEESIEETLSFVSKIDGVQNVSLLE